jgi:hypothetical protein
MEREIILTDEEQVASILGLPIERINFLKENHDLVCDEEGFSDWFVENAELVLEEMRNHGRIASWEASQAKTSENAHLSGATVPVSYDS